MNEEKDPTLRLYALVRKELDMPPGKLAAQAGHAFLDTWYSCWVKDSDRAEEYREYHQTKVVLAGDLKDLLEAREKALHAGLPCSIVVDEHHVLPPHFDGSPIITALGIGPATRDEIEHITGHLPLI